MLFSVDGDPAEVWKIASANGRTGFGPYEWDLTKLTFLVMAINGAFYAVQKYATDQTVVQRYLTAKTDRSAIRAILLGILLTVPVWILFMFIGTALFVFYKQNPVYFFQNRFWIPICCIVAGWRLDGKKGQGQTNN